VSAAVADRLLRVQWGGQLGDEWMVESGAPSFAKGERVLLFLRRVGRCRKDRERHH
jgi:hypothetical protein